MYSILLPPPLDPSIKMEVSSPGESARARQITHYQEPYYPCQTSSNWKYLGYQNIYFRSEQIHLWKDNGHQQVHQERGAAWVQAAHQTDSQDGELHLRGHVVINYCHTSAFWPLPLWSARRLGDLIWMVGGCLSQLQEQLYSFETLDWLLCEMLKQIDPFPAPYRTAITFLNAQFPHWLTDSFTH